MAALRRPVLMVRQAHHDGLAKDAVAAFKAGAVQRGRAALDAQVVEGQPAALQLAAHPHLRLVRAGPKPGIIGKG